MTSQGFGYRFGPFTLDPSSYRLMRDGATVSLSPKLIDLLLYLVARPSALASKEELVNRLWPDVAVTENALTQAVSELRHALGDDPAAPRYIQTVARRGYRFIASVTVLERDPAGALADRAGTGVAAGEPQPTARASRGHRLRTIAVTDFANVKNDPEVAWLSAGIAETVTNDLRALKDFRVIDRARIIEASRRHGGSPADLAAQLDVDLVVVGSYQRSGERLRITARVVEVATDEALADAKSDGLLAEVFTLQDRIVTGFAAALGVPIEPAAARIRARETSSLEAYRLFTEGRLGLEALDGTLVPEAIDDFKRAIELDPQYAAAYVGLANAYFWQYELSRDRNQPDTAALAAAVDHARRAIDLDPGMAEAHATLSYLLVSAGRAAEALAAARRAVALEPAYWAHQFRLGHASWGEERLRALARSLDLYPEFPFAHFEMAMVHIARSAPDRAEEVLREGIAVQARQEGRRSRFPAKGLHWLLGLTRLASGDADEAVTEFDREVAPGGSLLYSREFSIAAWNARGSVLLARGDPDTAATMFRRALDLYPEHARSLLGLAVALRSKRADSEAGRALTRARVAIDELIRGGRKGEAALATALDRLLQDRPAEAVEVLDHLLNETGPAYAGWTIPVEPSLAPLRAVPGFRAVLAKLAERAR